MSKSATVRAAVELFAERMDMSPDDAFEHYYRLVDDGLVQSPKLVKELLGAAWEGFFEEAKAKLNKTNESRRLKRKLLREEKEGSKLQQELARVDLSALMANTQSGFKNIYRYGASWRARVKVKGLWTYLSPKRTAEEAALQLYEWCSSNAPEELIPDELRVFYMTYKQNYANATHEDALKWAQELASTSKEDEEIH